MRLTTHGSLGRHEHGASLLVSLIFLVVMITIGTTLAKSTSLEERMASNTRDRDLALQAAEAALADAERQIQSNAALRAAAPDVDPMKGNAAADWEACFKDRSAPCTAPAVPAKNLTEGAGSVAQQPEYVVEQMPDIGLEQIYRVTARAVGRTEDTVVVLQAEYGYK